MDITLQPGDLLYMPRGTIHQGNCLEDIHSLHITVSCHQLNSYGDLMEKLLPVALKTAMEEDIEFRKGAIFFFFFFYFFAKYYSFMVQISFQVSQ